MRGVVPVRRIGGMAGSSGRTLRDGGTGAGVAAPVRRLGAGLGTYYTRAPRLDRICYVVSAVLFAGGLFHLGVQGVLGGPWDGPVSWRKPTTFGLSFGLTLATLTWVTSFVAFRGRLRARILAGFAVACVVEVVAITTQAWRQQPSHFNATTPLNAMFAVTAAFGGAIIVITGLLLTWAAFRRNTAVPLSMSVAIRAGIVAYLGTLGIGAMMIGMGVTARMVSQAAAYTVGAAYKSGHATLMHGILILPLLAWLLSYVAWSERERLRVLAVACFGYLLAAGIVVVDTFMAVNPAAPLEAPLINTVLAAAGIACLLGAWGRALVAVHRNPGPTGLEHP
jgi:hypothetical protein